MKKIALSLLMFLTTFIIGQTTTFKTYTVPVLGTSKIVSSIIYGNSLYYVYSSGGSFAIQKNDLNGITLLTKVYNLPIYSNAGIFLNSNNGAIYISGDKAATATNQETPFLAKIDTSNLSFIFCKEYLFLNNKVARLFQTKFLNNGTIMMCGGVIPSTYYYGLAVNVDAANGNVIYTNTLVVGAPTASFAVGPPTCFTSFAEISNSTILFSGYTDYLGGFISSAMQTATSVVTNSVFLCTSGGSKLIVSSNPSKVVAHQNSKFFKIDTSLSILNSTPPGSDLTYSVNGASRTFYDNGKVYVLNNSIDLDIYDDSFVHLSGNSYPFIAAGYSNTAQMNIGGTGNVLVNNSNLFITSAVSQDNNKFYMLKTSLTGTMPCYVAKPVSRASVSHASSPSVFASGPITYTVNSLSFTGITSPVSFVTNVCTPTEIKEYTQSNAIKISLTDNGYSISSIETINSYDLYDITGRVIKTEVFTDPVTEIKINLSQFYHGIYVARIVDSDKKEHKIKLVL